MKSAVLMRVYSVLQRVCMNQHQGSSQDTQQQQQSEECAQDLLRVIVWFHHIKSTEKRKNLVCSWARELDISGYSKPGYPGILVAEGLTADVRAYLARIRDLSWQAMQVRGHSLLPWQRLPTQNKWGCCCTKLSHHRH